MSFRVCLAVILALCWGASESTAVNVSYTSYVPHDTLGQMYLFIEPIVDARYHFNISCRKFDGPCEPQYVKLYTHREAQNFTVIDLGEFAREKYERTTVTITGGRDFDPAIAYIANKWPDHGYRPDDPMDYHNEGWLNPYSFFWAERNTSYFFYVNVEKIDDAAVVTMYPYLAVPAPQLNGMRLAFETEMSQYNVKVTRTINIETAV